MWILFALLSTALYSAAEAIDNFFVNKAVKHPLTLVFYSSLFNILYVPILFFFATPEIPPAHTFPLLFLLGIMNVAYLWPYYKGLQAEDTSVAISFLAIERIMVPALAFFVVGEILKPMQYIGIIIIIISVLLLGFHYHRKKITLSKGMWYLFWAALFLSGEAILFKLLFQEGVSVSTAVGSESVISIIFGLSILGITRVRHDIIHYIPTFIKISPIFLLEESFTFLALVTEAQAISNAPVSIVKGVTMSSPFFLLLYAWVGSRFFPSAFKEDLHRRKVIRKLILFAILIGGIILVKE